MNVIQRIRDLEKLHEEFELSNVEWEVIVPVKDDVCCRKGPMDFKTLIMTIENGLIQLDDNQLQCLIKNLCISVHAYIDESKIKQSANPRYCED